MPQNPSTRPRTVTPQDQAITPPNNELVDILARAGVTPFNPNGGSDLNSIIQGLLTPTPAPIPQKEGLLQTILSSLGSGVAAATQNPVLQQQLQTQQAQKFAAQQQERDASDRLNQIRQQFGLRLLDSQLGEQQDIRKESRTNAYRKEERIAAEAAAIREFNMQMQGKEQIENWNFKSQKALKDIDIAYRKERDDIEDTRFTNKEKQDLLEKKLDTQLGMVRAGLPVGIATSIVDKWFSGQKLTPKEEAALTATAQRALRLASGGGGRGGGGGRASNTVETIVTDGSTDGESGSVTYRLAPQGLSKAQAVQIRNQWMAKPLVQLRDGTVTDKRSLSDKDILLDAVRIDHELTPQEKSQYIETKIMPGIMGAMMPAPKQQTSPAAPRYNANAFQQKAKAFVNASQKAPSVFEKARYYQEQFDRALQTGDFTAEGVAKQMAQMAQQLPPEDKMIVEGIVIRNTTRKSNKSGTKTKVQMKGNKTPEQMKKEMDEFLRKGAQQ